MTIADRAAAFLNQVAPVVKNAAGNSMSQMQTFVKQAQQPAAQFLGQVGSATGAMLAGNPVTVGFGGPGPTAVAGRAINPGGILGAVGMKDTAAKVQAAMQDPRTTQMVGAGILGAGALGIGAAGAAVMNKKRKAGQYLGAQLGVSMPPD